jgi:hypothetical protein
MDTEKISRGNMDTELDQSAKLLIFLDLFSKLQPSSRAFEVLERLESSLSLIDPDIINKKNKYIENGTHDIPLKTIKDHTNHWPQKTLEIIDDYLQKKLKGDRIWDNSLT